VVPCILAFGIVGSALAHQAERLSVETLARSAAVVAEGRVMKVSSAWNAAGTQIHTTVTLGVSRYYKGDAGRPTLEITYLGGTVGDITFAVLGQPTFAVGEETFVFLAPGFAAGEFPLVGGELGKFSVSTDPATRTASLVTAGQALRKSAVVDTIERLLAPLQLRP
jgi:hypothetical protein